MRLLWQTGLLLGKLLASLVGSSILISFVLFCIIFFIVMRFFRKPVVAGHHAVMDRTSSLAAMAELAKIQQASGARLFAISGTLLGIHRGDGIIEHDDDLDFGIFADDPGASAFVRGVKSSKRFTLKKQYRLGWLGRKLNTWVPRLADDTLLYKFIYTPETGNAVELDIFMHFPVSSGLIAHGSTRNLWLNSGFELVPFELDGIKLLVPEDRDRYLRENYGVWEVPIRDFESALDCPNHHPIVTMEAAALLAWKLVKFSRGRNSRRLGTLQQKISRFAAFCINPSAGVSVPEVLRSG